MTLTLSLRAQNADWRICTFDESAYTTSERHQLAKFNLAVAAVTFWPCASSCCSVARTGVLGGAKGDLIQT